MKRKHLIILILSLVVLVAVPAIWYFRYDIAFEIRQLFGRNDPGHVIKRQKKGHYPVWGIDVSRHQREINWEKVAAAKPDFVFLKATEGKTHTDRMYEKNKKALKKHGIIAGAYHFFSYKSSGREQALHFIRTARLKPGDLPPVLDAEFIRHMPASTKKVRDELLAFIHTCEGKYGVKPIIYCTYTYFKRYLKNSLKDNYPLWISDFWGEPSCNWTFWQVSEEYRLNGIKGAIDYDVFRGSREELERMKLK